ncbi:phospholipase C-like protein [Pochonia chlamydosporia 170]|uniref:Phospholipase C-like protein n=1 Tax=Pochonia chlamydosporia 170 TaxID=1380566 RepID=A0A179G0K3_METCM|nr:phospholipase C-like protein [Pochonia chlamydosporia 170]OAQ70980.1 phospholipase C-like protein [Pochonia chlamydosporia 170]
MGHLRIMLAVLASIMSVLLFVQTATATPTPRQFEKCNRAVQDVCRKEDRTYSTQVPKTGSYMPWALIPLREVGFPAKQYITIVNLTPHRFVLDRSRTHSYQMDTFDWDDIPQGRSRQNTAEYTKNLSKNPVDDGGEAYYTIQGTNKRFEIRARTHIPDSYPRRTIIDLTGMGLGQREYLDPGKETAVTLVITGSDSYGFTASLRHGRGNWMNGMYNVIKDRKMQHIVMPATHDSGMSRISSKIGSIGTEENTQTQGLNIYDQLRAGARLFDLRVGSIHQIGNQNSYSFWTMHVNDELAKLVIGNTGESLDDVVREINQFTAENPGEVIFFRVRYLNGILDIPTAGPIYWSNAIVQDFFNKLKGVNNRCGNLDLNTKFNKQPASYFMDRNGGKGCVLFLLNGNLKPDVPQDSVSDGIYRNSMMDVWDNWSDLPDTEKMANDQAADWKTVSRSGNFQNDQFLIGQWIVSADPVTTTLLSIQNIGILPTNPALYWMGLNNMSPESWPTAILVDYIGIVVADQWKWDQLSAEMYTFAIGMNLYMISENCDINRRRSPLLPGANINLKEVTAQAMASTWNGIIYANGTVDDNPPPTLHPGRVDVLRKGTTFLNGTVVQKDVKNPGFGIEVF